MLIRGITLHNPDIQTIPYYNYQKFQRYLILDAGLGNDTSAILARVNNIQTHAAEDRIEDVQIESGNLVLSVFSALEGLSYESMAFACMANDIDGKTYPIASDSEVRTLSDAIIATGITQSEVQEYIDLLKKKLMPN